MRYALPLLLFFLHGCGYVPIHEYSSRVLGESIYANVHISLEDPQNGVVIKDAVDSAIITRFKTSLAPRSLAQTYLDITVSSVTFSPLRYNASGYVITYRTTTRLAIQRQRHDKNESYQVMGTYDFEIQPNAIISDQSRFEAIQYSAQKALDHFIAQIAAQGTTIP